MAHNTKTLRWGIKQAIYGASRVLGLFALCRVATRSRIRILGYHGASIGDEGRYNPLLFMCADTFRRRIHWLQQKHFNVITLDHAVAIMDGRQPAVPRAVVITFDDGWHSTASRLVPVLAASGLPSTLYLSTSDFQRGGPIPSVVVGYMMWKCDLAQVDIRDVAPYVDGTYLFGEPTRRDAFLKAAVRWLDEPVASTHDMRTRVLRLADAMGIAHDTLALHTRRFDYVNNEELRQLPKLGCAVELHGHHHRYPVGQPDVFAQDLDTCRAVIEQAGLPPPRHYCYPSGRCDAQAEAILNAREVVSAVTCKPGTVAVDNTPRKHYLARCLDGDNVDQLAFEAELSGFGELVRHLRARFARPPQPRARTDATD